MSLKRRKSKSAKLRNSRQELNTIISERLNDKKERGKLSKKQGTKEFSGEGLKRESVKAYFVGNASNEQAGEYKNSCHFQEINEPKTPVHKAAYPLSNTQVNNAINEFVKRSVSVQGS